MVFKIVKRGTNLYKSKFKYLCVPVIWTYSLFIGDGSGDNDKKLVSEIEKWHLEYE